MIRTKLVAQGNNWLACYEYNGEKLEVIGRTIYDCERLAWIMTR